MSTEMSTVAVTVETNHGLTFTVVVPKVPACNESPVPAVAEVIKAPDVLPGLPQHLARSRTGMQQHVRQLVG